MKKIALFILAAGLTLSCTNLEEEVYSSINKDAFFANENLLSIYSARAYTTLQAWGSEQSMWTMNLQLGNEVTVPMNSSGEWKQARYAQLQTHEVLNNNELIERSWEYCFNGIAACNDILYEIESRKGDFDGKDRVIAEMHMIRAFYYFLAIDCWGDVPFSISKEEKGYPEQKSRAEVFDFIESEILKYRDALAEENSPIYYGRCTLGMANTLLAKLYLNSLEWTGKERWADAEAACKAVMDSHQYSLCPKFEDNFAVHNEGSPEAIFAIPYSTVYTESDHNSFILFVLTLDGYLGPSYNINSALWDGFVGQPDFLASYEPGDLRRPATWIYGQQYDKAGQPLHIVVKDSKTGEVKEEFDYNIDETMEGLVYDKTGRHPTQGARLGKWEYQTDGLIESDQTSMDNDFHIFRYADVVLMYVEALVRQNRAAEAAAVTEFQQIRTRAGLAPISAGNLTLDNLYLERSHELAIEGWVRQDLIRFGKYLDPWWAKPAGKPYMKLLPIPNAKRASNPNIGQNEGY
ncbi:MAG: RagB/SusD family nutrient uptake outer membrane protein [Bacteroidales bacterium]|nr:RagB/SusD family nutrient uptake outer membrane protein [Bacteroidales bacterium]